MRLGLITTGQGPRLPYVLYHERLAAALGLTVEIDVRHILDGLDWDAIRPHLGGPDELRLGAHVHVPGATGNRLGEGWDHVYVRMDWSIPYFQKAIDDLVARGATCVLLCCAASFEPGALRCPVPLVRPATLAFSAVSEMVAARGRLRLGLMSSAGHGAQDVQFWRDQDFADRIDLTYEPFEGDVMIAAEKLARTSHDIVVLWSYGLGTDPRDPARLGADLEALFGCPVLMPHRLAALYGLGLMPAGFSDRSFTVGT